MSEATLTIDRRNLVEISEFQLERIKALTAHVALLEAKLKLADNVIEAQERQIRRQDEQIAELIAGGGAA